MTCSHRQRESPPASASIAESATLAVDAKAKALKAAGRPVIGFGAGEPDFPTPDYIVEAAVAACRDPQAHRYTPAGGLPELQGGDRRQDAARLRLRRHAPARCWSPTAASRPSTTPSPRCSTRATRCCCRRRTGRPTPSRSGSPAACPSRSSTDETTGYRVTVEQLEAARTAAHQGAAVRLPVEPDRRGLLPRRGRGDRPLGRRARASGSSPTRSTSTWSTTTPQFASMPALVPELADRCVVVNGVAKTYAMTGWRVGWMIGPADVVKAATNLQSHATSNVANVSQLAALAAVSGDLAAVAEMRSAFDRRRAHHRRDARRDRRRRLPAARGRLLRLPVGQGRAGPRRSADACRPPRPSSPRSSSTRPRWRWCPVRRSAPRATCACRTRSATTTWSRA